MPDDPLRWCVLGAGMIARGVTPCIARAEGCALVAMASRDPGRARAMLDELSLLEETSIGDAKALTYDELLAHEAIDAVYVTLPNHLHADWTMRLLHAGKHVLCEKPLCATRSSAEAVAETSRATGRLAAEGFMYTHHPQTDALVRLATSPDSPIGALERVHAAFCVHQTHEPTIRTRMSHACHGGSVMDLGCYSLSMVSLIAGDAPLEIERVDARVGEPLEGETLGVDEDIVVTGSFQTPYGVVPFTAESSFADPRGVHVTLTGASAAARTGWPWAPDPRRVEITLTSRDDALLDTMAIEKGGEKFQLQFEAFARAVRTGADFRPTIEWSVEQASTIERVRRMGGLPPFA